jgi:hypothetical protein
VVVYGHGIAGVFDWYSTLEGWHKLAAVLSVLALAHPALFSSSTVTYSYSYARDLALGSSGADVAELQAALEEMGFLTSSAVIREGHFGQETRSALTRYQEAHGISPAVGYFGPATRSLIGTRNVLGSSRSFDFRTRCSPGRFSFAGLFGHTDMEIVGARSGNCVINYGVESENPNWDGALDHRCVVPRQVWTFSYSDQIGIDLSPIRQYCKVIR